MALWAATAIEKGPDKVPRPAVIVGYGAADEAGRATYSGQLVVTLVQDPKDMGRKAVNARHGYWAHKAVDPHIVVPFKPYPLYEDTDGPPMARISSVEGSVDRKRCYQRGGKYFKTIGWVGVVFI